MSQRGFGRIFEASSVEQRAAGGRQEGGRAEEGGPARERQEGGW